MEMGVTTTNAAAAASGVAAEAEGFGTRLSSGRPHSIRLDRGDVSGVEPPFVSRGLDVLVGVGIGVAAMYYLDPATGSRRRARARETIAGAATAAPNLLDDATHALVRSTGTLLSKAAGRAEDTPAQSGDAEQTPTARLILMALGTALALFGGRRRDAVGAAAGVLGSALLAGGARTGRRPAADGSLSL